MSSNIHFLEKHKDTTSYIFALVGNHSLTSQISKTCQEITQKSLALFKLDYEKNDLIEPYIHKALKTCQTDAQIVKVVYELILNDARVVLDRLQIKQSAIDAGSKLSASRLVRLVEAVNAAKPQLAKDTIILFNKIAEECPKAKEFLDSQPQQDDASLANAITEWMKEASEDTFAEITSLALLNVKLHFLSPIIGKLTNLIWLDLDNNRLKTLPIDICKLTNLILLGLSNNKLQTLPPEIGNLIKLKNLYLKNNKDLVLPSEINQLIKNSIG